MFKTLYLIHTSPNKFIEFDINNFRENCLDKDTMQFGCYFVFTEKPEDLKIFESTTKRFGKRHGNKIAYLYKATTLIDTDRLINNYDKIDYETYRKLFKQINLDIDESIYAAYKTNIALFYNFCKTAYKKLGNWQDVANILIQNNFDGYYDNDSETDFGTIVLFNTSLINITEIIEY